MMYYALISGRLGVSCSLGERSTILESYGRGTGYSNFCVSKMGGTLYLYHSDGWGLVAGILLFFAAHPLKACPSDLHFIRREGFDGKAGFQIKSERRFGAMRKTGRARGYI